MATDRTSVTGVRLRSLVKSAVGGPTGQVGLWFYTSFGVIRGWANQDSGSEAGEGEGETVLGEIVLLRDAIVEHYSSHLPTATFTRLYIRLEDVMAFALDDEARQS